MGSRFSEIRLTSEPTFDYPLDCPRPDPLAPRPSIVPPLDLARNPNGGLKRRLIRWPGPPRGQTPSKLPTVVIEVSPSVSEMLGESCPTVDVVGEGEVIDSLGPETSSREQDAASRPLSVSSC
eukprot:RCo041732